MRVLLVLAALLFAKPAFAGVDCNVHKIYCRIVELRPDIDKDRAMRLSNYIFKYSKEFNVDPMVSVAILHQENRFRKLHTWKTTSDTHTECEKFKCVTTTTEVKEILDIGVAQINYHTAKWYDLDVDRLYNHDTEYTIRAHMLILRDKINQCKDRGHYAWGCYHSTTPKYYNRYVTTVKGFLSE